MTTGSIVTKKRPVCGAMANFAPLGYTQRREFSTPHIIYTAIDQERTLYASKATPRMQKGSAVSGGTPISLNVAMELTGLLFGFTTVYFRTPWLKTGLTFREPDTILSYGLHSPKRETKGFLMCVQSFILKRLLFQNLVSQPTEPDRLLQPSEDIQDDVLGQVLKEILWKMTEGKLEKIAVVCLPQENVYINESPNFSKDGVTETLHLFELTDEEGLHKFFQKYLHIFQRENGPGSLLFLYSILLTKGFDRIREELNKEYEQLLTPRGEGTQALVNLLLTGRATPFLHNGVVYESDLHTAESFAKIGIMDRSEIGYLMWQRMDSGGNNQVGSRLKTPRLPVWLTRTDGQYGVLFHTNRDLTRDYRAEYRFDLQYYTSSRCQSEIVVLTIDTRISRPAEEREIPALELLIMTKWQGAKIFWNGTTPFV